MTHRTRVPVRKLAMGVRAPVCPARRERVIDPYPGNVPEMKEVTMLAAPRATSSRFGLSNVNEST